MTNCNLFQARSIRGGQLSLYFFDASIYEIKTAAEFATSQVPVRKGEFLAVKSSR